MNKTSEDFETFRKRKEEEFKILSASDEKPEEQKSQRKEDGFFEKHVDTKTIVAFAAGVLVAAILS
jgi:formylmethanofuran dehydrogenase subunit E